MIDHVTRFIQSSRHALPTHDELNPFSFLHILVSRVYQATSCYSETLSYQIPTVFKMLHEICPSVIFVKWRMNKRRKSNGPLPPSLFSSDCLDCVRRYVVHTTSTQTVKELVSMRERKQMSIVVDPKTRFIVHRPSQAERGKTHSKILFVLKPTKP